MATASKAKQNTVSLKHLAAALAEGFAAAATRLDPPD